VTKVYGWLYAASSVLARRVIAFLKRRAAVGSRPAAWIGCVEQVIADLSSLSESTEQDFLTIGGKLREFRQTVNLVSADLAALTDLISGEQGSHASQALADALARSKEMEAQAAEVSGALRTIREAAGLVRSGLAESSGRVAVFRTLAVLTRIETARLGSMGAGFGNLADEVKSMAESIRTGVESALETAARQIRPVENALQNATDLQARESTDVSSVILDVLGSLQSLRDKQQAVQESSVRLASQYVAVSDSVGKMVVSIQFHDITRQQVEHVIETLRHVCSECGSGNRSLFPNRRTAAILALQASQLTDAGEKLAASVERIGQNLEGVAARVNEMAAESESLFGHSQDGQNSFFLEMERCCTVILNTVGSCADLEAEIQATADRLREILRQMRSSVEQVRSTEDQMRRMALNAGIRAAHLGPPGDALGVLAGALQEQGIEIGRNFENAFEALNSMNAAAGRLSMGAGGRHGQETVQRRMRATIEELHSSDERSLARIAQIRTAGARLSEEVSTIRGAFSAGRSFADVVSRSCASLMEIGSQANSAPAADGAEADNLGLDDLVKRYTMQAEHTVHDEATGLGEPVPVEACGSGDTEGLGDNIELF